jgi:hypothetical protein
VCLSAVLMLRSADVDVDVRLMLTLVCILVSRLNGRHSLLQPCVSVMLPTFIPLTPLTPSTQYSISFFLAAHLHDDNQCTLYLSTCLPRS